MSTPTNGSATMSAFVPSRSDAKRKIKPSRPAMSVCPNKCVWLVWISSGVRIHTFAAFETSPSVISFSALIWPWCIPIIGMSGVRLASTAAGETPTAVAAWVKAARQPHPMPTRNSVQKTLPLSGRFPR